MLIMTQAKNRLIEASCISVDHYVDKKTQNTVYTLRGRDASGNSEVLSRYSSQKEAEAVIERLGTKFGAIWIGDV